MLLNIRLKKKNCVILHMAAKNYFQRKRACVYPAKKNAENLQKHAFGFMDPQHASEAVKNI